MDHTGDVLLGYITTEHADAEDCQPFVNVKGMTRDFEYLAWRMLAESNYTDPYHTLRRTISSLPSYDYGELWIATRPKDGVWRIYTMSNELGNGDWYNLEAGKNYEVQVRIAGKFGRVGWKFDLTLDEQSKLSWTRPRAV
jgi:hypothetical protein